jgi:hypothetical protein
LSIPRELVILFSKSNNHYHGIAALVGPATRSECVKKGESMPPEANTNFQQLRDYIQDWIEHNNTNWNRLFALANLSSGTMMSIKNLDYLVSPSIRTLQRLADAMNIDPQILYIKAGLIDGNSDVLGRVHSEYDLDDNEKELIDAIRKMPPRYRKTIIEGAKNTAEAVAEDGDGA